MLYADSSFVDHWLPGFAERMIFAIAERLVALREQAEKKYEDERSDETRLPLNGLNNDL